MGDVLSSNQLFETLEDWNKVLKADPVHLQPDP
jgi:hypothetical protein